MHGTITGVSPDVKLAINTFPWQDSFPDISPTRFRFSETKGNLEISGPTLMTTFILQKNVRQY